MHSIIVTLTSHLRKFSSIHWIVSGFLRVKV
jgi:hypothetical protein